MTYVLGFLIALFIALTGVGAGTITVPTLVLFLGVPSAEAVGIGLMFSTAVKLILFPAQVARGNVAWKTLGFMLLGGAPGVLIGSLFLKQLVTSHEQLLLNTLLGVVLVATAGSQLFFHFRNANRSVEAPDRTRWLPWLMLPVGAEVGFSSAGAGALGSAALLTLTPLSPARVVGTDIAFGFLVSLIGSGAHFFSQGASPELLTKLVVGGVFGAVAGTLLSVRIPRRPLRLVLWIWLLILGGQFLITSYNHSTSKGPLVGTQEAPAAGPKQTASHLQQPR